MTYSIIPNAKIVKKWLPRTTVPFARRFKGEGILSGVISEKGQPVSGMIVQLFHNASNYFIGETVTEADGSYSFVDLDDSHLYDVIAFDPAGVWEKKVSSRRRPIYHPTLSVRMRAGETMRIFIEPEPVRYWRINVHSSNVHCALAELEMSDVIGGPTRCVNGVAISNGDHPPPGHQKENAFDGDYSDSAATSWAAADGGSGGPGWIGYVFEEPIKIVEVRIVPRLATTNQFPTDFTIESSPDGVLWYAVRRYSPGAFGWHANTARSFPIYPAS